MIDHPVVGIRLWQSLSINEIPASEPLTKRWKWTDYKADRLYGLQHGDPKMREWTPGVNTAVCARDQTHAAPRWWCTCGLYAYHDHTEIAFNAEIGPGKQWPYIAGIVRGWGQVYCHPNGWRAEKAEILAVFGDWGGAIPRIPAIASYYQVPILTKRGLPEIISEFGDPVPKEMRPKSQ